MRFQTDATRLAASASPHGLSWGALLLLALLGVASAGGLGCARPPVLRAYETAYFTVYADLSERQQYALSRDIEFAASAARFVTGAELSPPASPVELFLSGSLRDPWQYSESREQPFVFRESPRGAHYLLDGRRTVHGQRTQLEQALLHNGLRRGPNVPPLWFSIGFTAFLETLDIRGDSVVIGEFDAARLEAFRTVRPITMDIVLRPERMATLSPSRRRGYDAVAWLMVHSLMLESEEGTGVPPSERFRLYTRALEAGQQPGEALESAWGVTPTQLRHRVEAIARTGVETRRFRYETVLATPPAIERRRLPAADAALLRGRLRAAFGDSDRARARLEEAIRLAPAEARARAELARLEASVGRLARARELADDACLIDPGDPRTLVARAVVALAALDAPDFQSDRARLAATARGDLELARVLAPRDPEVLYQLGRLALVAPLRSPDEAIPLLEAASALLPNEREIRVALLDAYTRAADVRNAHRIAASLRTDAPGPDLIERIDRLLAREGDGEAPPWEQP